jgi:hypothetical protein
MESNLSRSPIHIPSVPGNMPVKKGGAGGKGAWGVPGDELGISRNISPNDPIYDADERSRVSHEFRPEQDGDFTLNPVSTTVTGQHFKVLVDKMLSDFVEGTLTVQETGNRLVTLNTPLYSHYFVRKAIQLGLPRRQEEIGYLLKHLTSPSIHIITKDQLVRGLSDAVLNMHEWELDAPNFRGALKEVILTLVDIDSLPSAFFEDELLMLEKRPVLKIRILDALEEFFVSFDANEFVRVLDEVNCAAFHGQVVKFIFRSAIEKSPEKIEKAAQLLATVSGPKKPISMLQFMQGIELVVAECEDILIDNPSCKEVLAQLIARTVVDDCVPPSLLDHIFAVAPTDIGFAVITLAKEILQVKGAAERVHNVWEKTE